MTAAREALHFVGIGGIGMAALAELFHQRGHAVSGSDKVASPTFDRLAQLGVRVALGHDGNQVGQAHRVVRSSAIADDNPELVTAREAGVPIVGRGALLAEVLTQGEAVAIAGSHGKTTTTALAAHLLVEAGLDPTVLVGGRVPRPENGASPVIPGRDDFYLAEVDESDGSFLLVQPKIAVLNNVDPEHLDHYGDRDALLDAFVAFANSVPEDGLCLLGIDHPGIREIAPRIHAPMRTFGFAAEADLRATSAGPGAGGQQVEARLPDGRSLSFFLPLPGRHNVLNALAALAIGLERGASADRLGASLSTFAGVARRYERRGEAAGVLVVDDYAHHPAELRAVLAGARTLHAGPITAVFQPHRFTRTRDCWADFTLAFEEADRVVVADIYAASESPLEGIDSARLADAITAAGHPDARHGGDLDAIAKQLPERLGDGELVLTLGAGDVVSLGPRLLTALEARSAAAGAKGGSR